MGTTASWALKVEDAEKGTLITAWDGAQPPNELNSLQAEGDPWLSNDGRSVIFASTPNGSSQRYEARR